MWIALHEVLLVQYNTMDGHGIINRVGNGA